MALIEREAAKARKVYCEERHEYVVPVAELDWLPTIDAAPVMHGRWEEVDWVEPDGHGFGTVRTPKAGLRCNQCANVFKKELLWKDSFCPNCGARMDGGEGHEAD